MDDELLSDIRSWQKKLSGLTELDPEQSQTIIDYVASNFVSDRRKRWWWESLRVESKTIEYGDGHSLELIRDFVSPEEVVFLLVTDDEHEPWPVISGRLDELLTLIGEQRYFEFILVSMNKHLCFFDTHHDTLVFAEALPAENQN